MYQLSAPCVSGFTGHMSCKQKAKGWHTYPGRPLEPRKVYGSSRGLSRGRSSAGVVARLLRPAREPHGGGDQAEWLVQAVASPLAETSSDEADVRENRLPMLKGLTLDSPLLQVKTFPDTYSSGSEALSLSSDSSSSGLVTVPCARQGPGAHETFTSERVPWHHGHHIRCDHPDMNGKAVDEGSELQGLRPEVNEAGQPPGTSTSMRKATEVLHDGHTERADSGLGAVPSSPGPSDVGSHQDSPGPVLSSRQEAVNSPSPEVHEAGSHKTEAMDSQESSQSIPRPIVVIAVISMALTSASCVFNTLLPIYMVTELNMTMKSMGVFEGLLEAFAYMVRMFSGVISDKMTSRKAAITLGFGMGAAAKFSMSFATSVAPLFVSKAVDRLANGVQAAPRDALIGDLSPISCRAACFGLAQSLRKWGACVGALLAYFLMKASNNNYQLIFMIASTVSLIACVSFALFVPSHPNNKPKAEARSTNLSGGPQETVEAAKAKGSWSAGVNQFIKDVLSMGKDFYRMLGVSALYAMGNINESLLELRALEVGFSKAESTLVVSTLCFIVFLVAYPLGRLGDKHGFRTIFGVGMASLIAGNLVLLCSGHFPFAVFLSCGFLGIHWAVIQGSLLAAVVSLSQPHLRGTAFGIFYTVMAVMAVVTNSLFGHVWHHYSATSAFGLSAAMTTVTLCLLPFILPGKQEPRTQTKLAMA